MYHMLQNICIQAKTHENSQGGGYECELVTKHFQQTIHLYGTQKSIAKKNILHAILAMQSSKQNSFRKGMGRTANKILLVIFNDESRLKRFVNLLNDVLY